ncbi:MAG: hypothetical protein ABR543_14360 [Gemmatimonadaceae bacterium]
MKANLDKLACLNPGLQPAADFLMEAERRAIVGAVCVLTGGLLLRFVIVMAP